MNAEEYQFVCENNGLGLCIVGVLQASGQHNMFLTLLSQYDPEGFAILSDAELSDKTVLCSGQADGGICNAEALLLYLSTGAKTWR